MKTTTTKTLNQSYLGLNMEIYLPLIDDISYLVDELCELLSITRGTLYKLVLDLSYYGHYYHTDNGFILSMDALDFNTISRVNDINMYNLKYAFIVIAHETLNAEFILIG